MKTEFQQYLEGAGTFSFWGMSPAFDLQANRDSKEPCADGHALHAALLGAGDVRHVLTTFARLRRWPEREVTVYLVDAEAEVMARHLLLLQIFYDPELGIRECAEVFLEVYGNTKVRPKTGEYLERKAAELVRLVTDGEGVLADLVRLDWLKFKERDELELIFLSWGPNTPFNIDEYRDTRLRRYYEDRYDFRANLIDWDLSMKICNWENGSIIHKAWFKRWRNRGLAFEFRDVKYTEPNRSLCSMTEGKQKGVSVRKRGYWGDIVHSPYIGFGLRCEDETMFEKKSQQHTKTPVQVCEHNVYSLLFESLHGKRYQRPAEANDRASKGKKEEEAKKIEEIPEGDEEAEGGEGSASDAPPAEDDWVVVDDSTFARPDDEAVRALPRKAKVVFVKGPVPLLQGKRRYANLFNRVYISNSHAQQIGSSFNALLSSETEVAVTAESAKYMLDIRPEHQAAFDEKLTELAKGAGWAPDAAATKALGEPFLGFSYTASATSDAAADEVSKEANMLEAIAL